MSQSKTTDRVLRAEAGGLPIKGATINVTVTSTAATSSVLTAGVTYELRATEDCYLCATAGTGAATSADYELGAGERVFVTPDALLLYISAIRKTADGTLKIAPRDDTVQ